MTANYGVTVYTQYNGKPTINTLQASFAESVSIDDSLEQMRLYGWDIDSALGDGLDIIGARVGVSRLVDVPAIFPVAVAPGLRNLDDEQYRALIRARAASNIAKAAPGWINPILQAFFAGIGNASVQTTGVMTARFVINGLPQDWQFSVLRDELAFPRATGVLYDVSVEAPFFGFAEADSWQPLDQGVFAP